MGCVDGPRKRWQTNPMDDEMLDLTGLKCPLPALMARKALAARPAGSRLVIAASDPMAVVDIPHMCHEEGHTVESVTREESRALFYVRCRE